ncbi:helix-turn-helix transcriptional regulator [Paenibacillus oryzisoli]|uniref:helix-turn-helix domain-containing protein n=1 Tax=Paenibacillus oryzisoli TaxID=1850517 RepID=UPI003D29182B
MDKANEEKLKHEIGRRVHELRTKRGESMDTFGKLIGTNSPMISNIENGKSIPGGVILLNMANACNVSIDWILKGETPKQDELREEVRRHIFFNRHWQFSCRLSNNDMSEENHKVLNAVFSLLENIQDLCHEEIELLSVVASKMKKNNENK